jgi:Asp-tRNA(Asn)/Glu-tRNA(Gln) amidotransferase B subunit
MTLPRINIDTILATLDKAVQSRPDEFAMATMLDGMTEQPELTMAIHEVINKYVEPLIEFDEDINAQAAASMLIELSACVYGITMKAMKAQADAEEMNEAWG